MKLQLEVGFLDLTGPARTELRKLKSLHCITCAEGKMHQTYSKRTDESGTCLLECVQVDTVGPMQPSRGGCRYATTATDMWSGYAETIYHTKRSQIVDLQRDLFKQWMNKTGYDLYRVRTDNAGELMGNAKWKRMITDLGGCYEGTAPRKHSQIGVAERSNRTRKSNTLTLLIESGFGSQSQLWVEAMNCTEYVRNHILRKRKDESRVSNASLFLQREIRPLRLGVFGSLVVSLRYPEERHKKFSNKGERGIFLGYAKDKKAYRILSLTRRRIIERAEADVRHFPEVFPKLERETLNDAGLEQPEQVAAVPVVLQLNTTHKVLNKDPEIDRKQPSKQSLATQTMFVADKAEIPSLSLPDETQPSLSLSGVTQPSLMDNNLYEDQSLVDNDWNEILDSNVSPNESMIDSPTSSNSRRGSTSTSRDISTLSNAPPGKSDSDLDTSDEEEAARRTRVGNVG